MAKLRWLLDVSGCARLEVRLHMSRKTKQRTLDEVVGWLRDHGFQVSNSGSATFISKNRCVAEIAKNPKASKLDASEVLVLDKPGIMLGGEVSRLIDRGYQKFLKTTKIELPATAEHLQTLHAFNEELR